MKTKRFKNRKVIVMGEQGFVNWENIFKALEDSNIIAKIDPNKPVKTKLKP